MAEAYGIIQLPHHCFKLELSSVPLSPCASDATGQRETVLKDVLTQFGRRHVNVVHSDAQQTQLQIQIRYTDKLSGQWTSDGTTHCNTAQKYSTA